LRALCAISIKNPARLLSLESDLLKLFNAAEDCIYHITNEGTEKINQILTEEERRRVTMDPERAKTLNGKNYGSLRVSPNSPLAAQVVEDRVIDMLIFLTFRFSKVFE